MVIDGINTDAFFILAFFLVKLSKTLFVTLHKSLYISDFLKVIINKPLLLSLFKSAFAFNKAITFSQKSNVQMIKN